MRSGLYIKSEGESRAVKSEGVVGIAEREEKGIS